MVESSAVRPEPIAPHTATHLAGLDRERHLLDGMGADAVVAAVARFDGDAGEAHREIAELEDRRGRLLRVALELDRARVLAADGASHHHRDDVVGRRGLCVDRAHRLAVAQHGDAIADGEDLVHAMRDVDARGAVVAQTAQPLHQAIGLLASERRGGLVEDEDLGVLRERADDLDDLLQADAEDPDGGRRIDVALHAELREQLARVRLDGVVVDEAEEAPEGVSIPSFPAQDEVRRDRELRHQHELLVHDRDAGLLGVACRHEAATLAADLHGAAVAGGGIHAGEDLEDGRLASAVLAAQPEDLAGPCREIRAAKRVDAAERLVDRDELECQLGHLGHRRRRRTRRASSSAGTERNSARPQGGIPRSGPSTQRHAGANGIFEPSGTAPLGSLPAPPSAPPPGPPVGFVEIAEHETLGSAAPLPSPQSFASVMPERSSIVIANAPPP